MKSDQQRLKALLSTTQRTAEDEAWLQSYLQNTDAAELRELSQELFEQHLEQHQPLPAVTTARMWEHIRERTEPANAPVRRNSNIYWWAAAAAAVLAITAYPLLTRQHKKPAAMAHIIQPAGNKAVLTLADGSKVTLSDTGNQVIKTGNLAIEQHEGELQYRSKQVDPTAFNVLETPRGGVFQVTLPDGTHVWLNAASSLKYPVTFTDKRMVTLNGQAYFEIAPDARHPFFVQVADMEVQVLGTSFDVMAYNDEQQIHTTLVSGAVRVLQHNNSTLLQPGQQSRLDPATGNISVLAANVDQVLAWRNGKFELENTDLPAFLRQLARWYDIDIRINASATAVAAKKFGGQIGRDMNLQDVMKILELYDIQCRLENRTLTVVSVQ
ncbi:FecR family protein [Chitinophaga jiangningensis]|uniref:FecR family protein n=1 Tax=Chitinophaga jiangningensis TaxID=1419482 RepID=A0A1M7CIW5_9BACT|nr:FecR family protein [Chitinophaga jiangningensis]SHL67126.1 FecR family protein [Chitinophaga jiangningensis]